MNESADKIRRWREDPAYFVRDQFGVEPDAWQLEVLEAFPHSPRLAMKACKGPGKTALLAWCAWNFLASRPHPKVVTPGAQPGQPPSDAVVLFDGKDLSKWTAARLGTAAYKVTADPAPWRVASGYFEVVPRSGDIASKERFGDVQVHVEWMEPAGVSGTSQNRGNSGIFLMGLFEIQVLDSFRSRTYADGQAAAPQVTFRKVRTMAGRLSQLPPGTGPDCPSRRDADGCCRKADRYPSATAPGSCSPKASPNSPAS